MEYRLMEIRVEGVTLRVFLVYKYKFLEIYGRFLDGLAAFLYHN